MVIAPWLVYAFYATMVIAIAAGIYNYQKARKAQKKNQQKPSQIDGQIADEGATFCSIDGSPQTYGNLTHIYGHSTIPIKSK